MPQIVRHQIGAVLLEELRREGLGVRDLFEGRQEPLSWHFRGMAYDQSELDILESGVVEALHAPSALVELVVDEVALACANLGTDGLASYLALPGDGEPEEMSPGAFRFHPETLLGYLSLDAAPPARWLDERDGGPEENERLASRLAGVAHGLGDEADEVEVHIEGAVDAGREWGGETDAAAHVQPAGVSLYFSFDIPLVGTSERELADVFGRAARTASAALEQMRGVFRRV